MMNPSKLAELIGVTVNTVRRWTWSDVYGRFLTPQAAPEKGRSRSLTEHDQRVLYFVATMRKAGREQDYITSRLEEMQNGNWRDLPDIPSEWRESGETIAVEMAVARAGEVAQIAVLQTELNHLKTALQSAENRVKELEDVLAQKEALEGQNHALQIELERARADVRELQARLASYTLGTEKPVSIALIIAVVALAAALVVALAVLLGALVG